MNKQLIENVSPCLLRIQLNIGDSCNRQVIIAEVVTELRFTERSGFIPVEFPSLAHIIPNRQHPTTNLLAADVYGSYEVMIFSSRVIGSTVKRIRCFHLHNPLECRCLFQEIACFLKKTWLMNWCSSGKLDLSDKNKSRNHMTSLCEHKP